MRLYGILENDANGREARKGSDSVLTVKFTKKGLPTYVIEYTGETLTVQDRQTGAIVYEVNSATQTS